MSRGLTNNDMIILARESRGINQNELADRLSMSKANLSKIERGEIGVSEDVINRIAEITHYRPSFFEQQNDIYPEHLIYRKRDKVAQSLLTPINAKVNIIRFHIQYIREQLERKSLSLPNFEVSEENTPRIIAQKLRKAWGLENGIVVNTVKLLEEKGIVLTSFQFGTERVDSRCVLTEDKCPIIIYNNSLLGDRQRFSIIYQLGHLIMHTAMPVGWERDITNEANLFAAEFLMPEEEIKNDFKGGLTLPLLGELKRKWKVSMISLLYRADDLGYLTANQKRYLLQQFNELKIRRREPIELDIAVEKPTLVRKWLADLKDKHKLSVEQLAGKLHLETDEFIELYN